MSSDRAPLLDYKHLRAGQVYRVRRAFVDVDGREHRDKSGESERGEEHQSDPLDARLATLGQHAPTVGVTGAHVCDLCE